MTLKFVQNRLFSDFFWYKILILPGYYLLLKQVNVQGHSILQS